MASCLRALSQHVEITWVSSALAEGHRKAAENAAGQLIKSPLPERNLYLRFVVLPPSTYHKYYNVFCNPFLWFLHHGMWNAPHTPNINTSMYDAWEDGYLRVNQGFAEALISEASQGAKPPCLMLHGHHLYLVAGLVRAQVPQAVIQHFIPVPWPTPHQWQLLPRFMRQAICLSLCACDIVGLQTRQDALSFLQTCEAFCPEAHIDYATATVATPNQRTLVKVYPTSVDIHELQRALRSPRMRDHEARVKTQCGEYTIVRVDRAEPNKNVIRGFRAFELLLERHPQFLGKVKFLAFVLPSRPHIRQYQHYTQEILSLVQQLNAKYGTGEWQPLTLFHENNYLQALTGMKLYDVLLVSPVMDGMNLVAKEGPLVNEKNGVLILSETAGAYEQLGEHVLAVSPADLEGTTQALYTALTMLPHERQKRAQALKATIEREDMRNWLQRQLDDILAWIHAFPSGGAIRDSCG